MPIKVAAAPPTKTTTHYYTHTSNKPSSPPSYLVQPLGFLRDVPHVREGPVHPVHLHHIDLDPRLGRLLDRAQSPRCLVGRVGVLDVEPALDVLEEGAHGLGQGGGKG
jgi:hypothetical protein